MRVATLSGPVLVGRSNIKGFSGVVVSETVSEGVRSAASGVETGEKKVVAVSSSTEVRD
jgi:hypothetical protein